MTKENDIVIRSLEVKLTEQEILGKSRELAKAQLDIKEKELQLKSVQDDFKDKISALESEIGILSRAIANGSEYRDIECRWEYDWPGGTKTLVRLDTMEDVKKDVITQQERQQKLNAA